MPARPLLPFADPKASYLAHKDDIDAAVRRVLEGGWYILGPEVTAFEKEFAAAMDVTQAIGVGSGTEALHLALRACGVGLGDEDIRKLWPRLGRVHIGQMDVQHVHRQIRSEHPPAQPGRVEEAAPLHVAHAGAAPCVFTYTA